MEERGEKAEFQVEKNESVPNSPVRPGGGGGKRRKSWEKVKKKPETAITHISIRIHGYSRK